VFDDEVIDHLPREPHDQPVTGAVTPARTVEF
jgi:5-formyltetrahydrofolate cyclo-ligase